ncbi:MAG TPA: hypothetical protein PLN21_01940 [Gemmatales bacterium]|nr:hypothetical protein [Gemmatales bacterium]
MIPPKMSREAAEFLLGKPTRIEKDSDGFTVASWEFVKQSFDEMECFTIRVVWSPKGELTFVDEGAGAYGGRSVWEKRWSKFKEAMGF